jgi:hypothetical protein
MRSLRRTLISLLTVVLLLITAPRLPAPIVEEVTPSPKPAATAKPKPKAVAKPKPVSLAGNWTGTVDIRGSDGSVGAWDYGIRISPDGKTAWTKWRKSDGSWGSTFQSACQGDGNLLSWRFAAIGGGSSATQSLILQVNGNGTATLTQHQLLTGGPIKGHTNDGTGILTRQ